eukprot:TRINITY_DN75390_c0_g1_i1.p1 TRINITY_DN75390_c0_g1~~TRINITY_DN75390_c0_g1_i1.p1  ORF type:complete len:591 (+),score=86.70 TRINITY_DN75390_c0_g1_i1:132-1904(+)
MGNVCSSTGCMPCFTTSRRHKKKSQHTAVPMSPVLLWQRSAWASPVPPGSPPLLPKGLSIDADAFGPNFVQHKIGHMLDAGVISTSSSRPVAAFFSEQLLASPGSLPRTTVRRSKSSRRIIAQLTRTPQELLVAKGDEGQRLRLSFLKGATIVFFTAGYEGKRFVYERAHSLGIRSVIIDNPDSWSRNLLDEGIIADFIPVDMGQSSDVVYDQSLKAILALGKDASKACDRPVDAITTVVELSIATVARLAEALELPGHSPDAVDFARDKRETRILLEKAGLPTPRFARILSAADLDFAADSVGFPAVLKPVSGAASLGVKKVTSRSDLTEVYEEVMTELSSLVVSSGALMKGTDNADEVQAGSVIGTVLLLEQFLDGNEVDVDIVMSEGEWRYAAVSDNGPTLEPYFNETWAVTPSLLPRDQQTELRQLAVDCVKALGFIDGVFHVECKATSHGPHLIEVNARMGGGPVHATNLKTWNVDLVDETLLAAVGIPSRPDVPKKPVQCIANSDVNATRSGILADVGFLEPLRGREGIVSFTPHVEPGAHITGPADGLPTWLVEIVVTKPTSQEALDFLFAIESEVQAKVRFL